MTNLNAGRVLITEGDLAKAAAAVEARFADTGAEHERQAIIRDLLSAGLALEQAVRIQSRCALVNHCGSHGTTNLADATETLFQAIFRYAEVVREIAGRFGRYDLPQLQLQGTEAV
jgi:hypothetical protein